MATAYHRFTAEGIETMDNTPSYTFQCKVCGSCFPNSEAAYDHHRQHILDITFSKTVTDVQPDSRPLHEWINDVPNSRPCELNGCTIPPQYLHHCCLGLFCPQHVVRHQRNCTFKHKGG